MRIKRGHGGGDECLQQEGDAMNALFAPLGELPAFAQAASAIARNQTVWCSGVVHAQKWHLAAGLLASAGRPALVIAPSELKAKEIYQDLSYFLRDGCCYYPSRDMIFYAADVKSVDITRQRLQVVERLEAKTPLIVILSAEALLDRLVPPDIFATYRQGLSVGDVVKPEDLIRKLASMGYERSGLAEGAGQFSVRGGILDIFPAVARYTPAAGEKQNFYLNPGQSLRLEFFGDEIDSIRVVDALSQRSVEKAASFMIYPVRELVFGPKRLRRARERLKAAAAAQQKALGPKEARNLGDIMEETLIRWSDTQAQGADAFFPFFYEEECNLLDYLPGETVVFFDEPNPIALHMETVLAEYQDSISHRLMAGRLLPEQAQVLLSWPQVLRKTDSFARVLLSSMTGSLTEFAPAPMEIPFQVRTCTPLRHKSDELAADLGGLLKKHRRVVILAGTRRHGQRLTDAIREMDIPAHFAGDLAGGEALPAGIITVGRGALSGGFEYSGLSFAVITDKDLFSQEKARRRARKKIKNAEKINHFTDLRVGDPVVHENHGIGVFRGIEQVVSEGLARDYLKLEYADGGHLYVQTSQMDLVHKYIGGAQEAKLNKLGGADWSKAKARARQAVEIMAADLVALYAKRQASRGHVYGEDTVWQSEFESHFPYTETDDQVAAIEDVKRDMESPRVMDRLLCGDVGYGKTEVAIRAAFKAVQDGKQVAYLVPTTILAQQHYQTFVSRMKDYPVKIERLSRFQSRTEQLATIKNLTQGASDIVIGTHRLLSKDVAFKDLGLIIVDEEQRFGVGHKEKLKEMRADVDVLTLTATPIPRTLHFSLTGIRDMSLLDEPPEERQPIQTYVMESNNEFVRDAINRELARGGQVYYLHNRVRNIAEEAARVAALVPQARVAFAHGQMSEHELENIMQDFVAGDVDVLVCTTIVETGLDIPNVNTIIIQNADFMGLAQLYQLRGRVGRSSRLAYAYLMYRRDKILREDAEKRLQTIREFTEFGAGFKIAMRDLEIRGAGNLLGAQQHGHMDAIGYDMYCKLLSDAVSGLKGEPPVEAFETTIDISVDAYIPDRFIPDEQQKLEIYKKIALITAQGDYFDVQEEIEDRFGTPPRPVANLLEVALMKAHAQSIGVISVTQKGQSIVLTFRPDATVDVDKLTRIVQKNPARLLFTMAQSPTLTIKAHKNEKPPEDGGGERVKMLQRLLERLK
ncbi:MAG: transcription-repair coupling factor [Defluviitaleaceae bacterium]|nr:transcription-repair coupling factor [Defluviitaleaceae bacterium]